MNSKIHIFPDSHQLSSFLAGILRQKSEILNRKLTLALSGGSTPATIFKYLVQDFASQIDWPSIDFFFNDERCVPPDHPESNYKLANDHLFRFLDIPEENIFRIHGENSPVAEASRYSQVVWKHVPAVNGIPSFDICLLGVGEDGHTASIFPRNMDLFQSKELYQVTRHPQTDQTRITATGTIINNSDSVIFLITGKQKANIVSELLARRKESILYPAAMVQPIHGNLYWLLDAEAASLYTQDI